MNQILLNPFTEKIKPGISVFTAIKDRAEMLEKTLPNWLEFDNIDEIVIVDWSSKDSLLPLIESCKSDKIVLSVVSDQPQWILSHAYNLAARLTSRSVLLKLDADILLRKDFFNKHILTPGRFFTGNWRTARNDNEKHLHGTSYLFRDDFFKINGYNEFVKTYGWDDIDLYNRLKAIPLSQENLDPDQLFHIEHSNRTKLQSYMQFLSTPNDKERALLNSLINRFIIESLPEWSTANSMLGFQVTPKSHNLLHCTQTYEDKNLLPPGLIEQCESQAVRERFFELGVKLSQQLLKELNKEELINLLNIYYKKTDTVFNQNIFSSFLKFSQAYSQIIDTRCQFENNLHRQIEELYALKQKEAGQHKKIEILEQEITQLHQKVNSIQSSVSWKLGHGIVRKIAVLEPFFSFKGLDKNAPLPEKKRKINLGDEIGAYYGQHRSGWSFAIKALEPLHNTKGIALHSFIERTFQWHPKGVHPHLAPWIGFIHVPPKVPSWFAHEVSNQTIFSSPAWEQSLPFCKGLFTLSAYHKKNLESLFSFPVENLIHPTNQPVYFWNWEKFRNNPQKKVIQIGFWLRKLYAIHVLNAPNQFGKYFIRKENVNLDHLLEAEKDNSEYGKLLNDRNIQSVKTINFLSDLEYDKLLAENIVFLELYDASANNTVIECIIRNTPILINPIEPVVEYLGKDYPFYFRDIEEATKKLNNMDLIYHTHLYLLNHPIKKKMTADYFCNSVIKSKIYRKIDL
jgi:hypothetical protein